MNERLRLYKAIKYEVETFHTDCGYTLPEMWDLIKNNDTDTAYFWHQVCLIDYDKYMATITK